MGEERAFLTERRHLRENIQAEIAPLKLRHALRADAGGAGLARTATEGFDFTAVFLVFATALAMTANNPREEGKLRALHHFDGFRARCERPFQR